LRLAEVQQSCADEPPFLQGDGAPWTRRRLRPGGRSLPCNGFRRFPMVRPGLPLAKRIVEKSLSARLVVSPAAANPCHLLLSGSAWRRLGAALELSPRELQIVQGIFDDQKENAIAAGMGISPHTVNTYFERLYRKLRVCSRSQLIVVVVAAYFALAALESKRT